MSLQTPVVRADWVLIDSGSFDEDVDEYTIVYAYWTDFTAGQRIQLDWSTGIIGVHFLILSEENFNAYINSQLAYVELSTDGGSAVTVIWDVPRNGETWYAAWHNRGFIPTHLTCTWYQYEWEGPPAPWYTDPILLVTVIIVASVLVGLVVCVIQRHRRRISKG
jgi:hypothetical protein